MFVNAENGASGVNFHGGETGMDGTKPFYYEPIMEDNGAVARRCSPSTTACCSSPWPGTGRWSPRPSRTTNPNFTAYAIKASGFTSVILDNKNATQRRQRHGEPGMPGRAARARSICRARPPARCLPPATAVTLAGASVPHSGVWNRNAPYIQTSSGNTVSVYVPPASAALVRSGALTSEPI